MNKKLSALTLVTASALALGACSSGAASSPSATESTAAAGPQNITLWLAGGDTPDALRDYLKTTYKANNGGTLTIRAEEVHLLQADCAGQRDARPGHFIRVSVTDTGVGIAVEHLERVLDPFYTTHNRGLARGNVTLRRRGATAP